MERKITEFKKESTEMNKITEDCGYKNLTHALKCVNLIIIV